MPGRRSPRSRRFARQASPVRRCIAIQFAGFFAPLDTAEPANRYLAHPFPTGYFLPVVRGMYLKGAGIAEYWRELLALALYAVVVLWLAHALFHKRTKS
jgi:ABC-2 type transport system permease protein